MKKYFFSFLAALPLIGFSTTNSYVCPNSYQTIMLGYSTSQVSDACGQPESATSQQTMSSKQVGYLQWIYTANGPVTPTSGSIAGQSGPQLLITFSDDKVTQISVSNQVNTQNFPCYSMGRIQIGISSAQVMLQCGQPRFVNNIQQAVSVPVTMTTWTYNFGSYKPTMIFTFEDDKLTDISMGQLAK